MNFLAPLFLAGLAAIALPVLLHLRRNRPKQTIVFSSLMFLDASPPITKRRSRIQDLLLLLLRCLAIALLAFAFARPFFPASENKSPAGDSAMHFILIDTSASMRGDPLDRALKSAAETIGRISENDWIALATFSNRLTPLVTPMRAREIIPGDRKTMAGGALDSIKAQWSAVKMDTSLLNAAALATEAAGEGTPVKLHVFSDFKKDAASEALRAEDWPDSLQIVPHRIELRDDWTNAGVHILAVENVPPRVRISNAEGSAKSDFKLNWTGSSETQSVSVPPGESALMDAPPGIAKEGKVTLSGDDFSFDNESAWTQPQRPVAKVRYIGKGEKSDVNESLFFLSRAMQPTAAYNVEIASSDAPDLTVASGALNDIEIESSRQLLKDGANILLTIRDVESAPAVGKILGIAAGESREAAAGDFALLGEIDFDSSVFAPFADARYSDFSSIRFWKHRVLSPEITSKGAVLARFDSGDPAWLQFSIGKGTLHVLTTTWRPIDSQLALSPKFPTLLHSLLSQSPALSVRAGQYFVDQPVTLPAGIDEVTLPDGSASKAATPFTGTTSPGIYRAGSSAFAVQIDPTESEITPLSDSELSALGLPLDDAVKLTGEATLDLSNAEQESRQRIGWWLLVIAALFLVIETIWAARRGARATPATA